MAFVITRKIDNLGRMVLPVEIRRYYCLSAGDMISLRVVQNEIILTKETERVRFTKKIDDLGRIVIPKHMRDHFHLQKEDCLAVLPCPDGIHVCPADRGER